MQRDKIIADIEWRWRILTDAPPLWLESITVSIVGQERKILLAQEREKSLSEQKRRSRELETEIEKKKRERRSQLKALEEAEWLEAQEKRKVIDAERRAIRKEIQEKKLREESERQAKIIEARKYYERASLLLLQEESERQSKIKIEQETLRLESERQAKLRQENRASERLESERQAKLRQENRASEIKRICGEYGIDTLIHFTRVQNLSSILQNGLLGRNTLENQQIRAQYNDLYRFDGCRNAISLSISFPNYQMFYRYSNNNRDEWVVLLLNSSILWELDCAFCQENAASNNVTKISLETRKQPSSLGMMFTDYGQNYRKNLRIQTNYPTHPQAEVLVFNQILPHNISQVHFLNLLAAQQWIQNHSGNYNNLYYSDQYFRPRADYQAWSPKQQSIISTDDIDF